MYHIKTRHTLDDWAAFEKLLELSNTPARRTLVDAHFLQAASDAMLHSYRNAADLIRLQGKSYDEVKHLIPSYRRVRELMTNRQRGSLLEAHHTATKEWAKRLLRNENPTYMGWADNDPRWTAVMDEMPAYLMDEAFHRMGGDVAPKFRDLTRIINAELAGVNPDNTADILDKLGDAYHIWEVQAWGGDDMWTVARAWLKSKGVR